MATTLKYPTSVNCTQKTLDAALLAGVTAAATLNSVVGIQNKAGVFVVDRVDSNGTATPSKREYIIFTGVSGSTLTTLTRNADGGGTDQDHAVGAIVEFVSDVLQEQAILDGLLLTVTTAGVLNRATGANINTGTDDDKIVTPKAIADSYLGSNYQSLARNCIINAGFTVNQRVYVSNAALAAGIYGHDRWKAGADGGDYTFTQLAQSTVITIKAAKTLIQVIEDKNVIGGIYTLSWTGTAQARYAVDSATPAGAYAVSPIAITGQTAGTVMSVEFNAGTLSNVVLNSGTVALPFMPKSFEEELRACQRYCIVYKTVSASEDICMASGRDTTGVWGVLNFPVEMMAAPTLTVTADNWQVSDFKNAVIACTDLTIGNTGLKTARLLATVAAGVTAYRPYTIGGDETVGRKMILSAEL